MSAYTDDTINPLTVILYLRWSRLGFLEKYWYMYVVMAPSKLQYHSARCEQRKRRLTERTHIDCIAVPMSCAWMLAFLSDNPPTYARGCNGSERRA